MNLSLFFILHELDCPGIITGTVSTNKLFYSGIRLFRPDTVPGPETVCICSPELTQTFLSSPPSGCRGCILLSEPDPAFTLPALWLPNETDSMAVMERVMSIFSRFQDWGERLCRAAAARVSPEQIFHYLDEVTPNPWYMADTSFRMQIMREDPLFYEISAAWRYQVDHGCLPALTIQSLLDTGEMNRMYEEAGAFCFKAESFNNPFVSRVVIRGDDIIGFFFIICVYTRISEYEVEIADYFGEILTLYLKKDASRLQVAAGSYFDSHFINMIRGLAIDEQTEKLLLKKFGWNMNDRYIVFLADIGKAETQEQPAAASLIRYLEDRFPCKAFVYDNRTVAVICLSGIENTEHPGFHFQAKLKSVCRDRHCHGSCSDQFTGLLNIPSFYSQAVAALSDSPSGQKHGLTEFRDVAASRIMKTAQKELPDEWVIHPAVIELQNYDKSNETNLLSTLKCYLGNEQNALQTARDLYIHRNTLLYRLERIRQLTGIDLNNSKERLRLELSFLLI